jgi:hypothetical protein
MSCTSSRWRALEVLAVVRPGTHGPSERRLVDEGHTLAHCGSESP